MYMNTLAAVVIGGVFTLLGGALQSFISFRADRRENKTKMKINVLTSIVGNRAALTSLDTTNTQNLSEGEARIREYKRPFFSALNEINVTFNDNSEVIEKYNEFYYAITSQKNESDINELLYKLIKSMYEDLNMKAPSREHFYKIIL